ncbi:MAG: hypothetical protein QM296_02760, partial [Bacillota bacterium]|nr:hypothetical protein [Bacillota bacterium]
YFDQNPALRGQSSLISKSFFGFHVILTRIRPFVVKVAWYPNRFLDFTSFWPESGPPWSK